MGSRASVLRPMTDFKTTIDFEITVDFETTWGNPKAHQARFQDLISKLKFDALISRPLAQRAPPVSDFESTDCDPIAQVILILRGVSPGAAGLECKSTVPQLSSACLIFS